MRLGLHGCGWPGPIPEVASLCLPFFRRHLVPLTRRGQTFGRYLNCRVRPSCRDDDERLERGLVKRFAGVRDNGRDLWMGQQTTGAGVRLGAWQAMNATDWATWTHRASGELAAALTGVAPDEIDRMADDIPAARRIVCAGMGRRAHDAGVVHATDASRL